MNFDRLAPIYRRMELVAAGGKLQRCRLEFLGQIVSPARILLAGEGHGRFLPECVKRFPLAAIVVVDSSARMLDIGRSKVDSPHVKFVHADLVGWEGPADEFDLIVTNFFLDCFPEDQLAVVVSKLGKCATADAQWLLADFAIAPSPLAGFRSRVILAALYAFFRMVCGLKADTLIPPDDYLEKAGFVMHRQRTYEWGLLKSEWWVRSSGTFPRAIIPTSSDIVRHDSA